MPRTIRFHLDENCSHAIAAGLRRRGVDVTTTPEVGLLGAIDEDQIGYCLAQGRVIFSYDDDLLRLAASGLEHAGVVYCRQRKRSIGEIVRGLVLIRERLDPADLAGQIKFLYEPGPEGSRVDFGGRVQPAKVKPGRPGSSAGCTRPTSRQSEGIVRGHPGLIGVGVRWFDPARFVESE
jgi:hypothetical protein